MKLLRLGFIAMVLASSPVHAQQAEIIDVVMKALGEAGLPPRSCATPATPSCSFTQICTDLSAQRNSPYLYENAAGERIPNFNYQQLAGLVMQCGQQKGLYQQAAPGDFHPLEFNRWLIQQPPGVQLNFSKIELAYADAAYAQTLSAQRRDETDWGYMGRQLVEAAERAGVEVDDALADAIQRKINHQQTLLLASKPATDWSQVPARVREVMLDPFLNPELLSQDTAEGSAARGKFNSKAAEIAILGNEVRAQTLEVLENQRVRYPERAASLEAMSVRLRTARISFVTNPFELKNYCPSPNAFYDPTDHTLKICPQMMGMPKEHLRMVIGHELGHSVDPCGASCPLHVVQAGPETQYSVADLSSVLGNAPGVYTGQVAAGVTYQENPFREVLSCLSTPESLNARLADPARARTLLEEQIRIQRASGQDTTQNEQLLAALPRLMSDYAGCSILPGNSRQQEAFADWLAAEAVAVSGSQTNLTEIGGMFYALECPGVVPDLTAEILPILQENNCMPGEAGGGIENFLPDVYQVGMYLGQLQQQQDDSHPATVDRINRLFRLQPRLNEQMGCGKQDNSGSYCAP